MSKIKREESFNWGPGLGYDGKTSQMCLWNEYQLTVRKDHYRPAPYLIKINGEILGREKFMEPAKHRAEQFAKERFDNKLAAESLVAGKEEGVAFDPPVLEQVMGAAWWKANQDKFNRLPRWASHQMIQMAYTIKHQLADLAAIGRPVDEKTTVAIVGFGNDPDKGLPDRTEVRFGPKLLGIDVGWRDGCLRVSSTHGRIRIEPVACNMCRIHNLV